MTRLYQGLRVVALQNGHLKIGAVCALGALRRSSVSQDRAHGWQIEGGRIGHGMGLDYAERPSMTESNEMLLQHGMTGVVHTAFALPGSGKMFVPLGDVCHATSDGFELLMEFPRTPFVAG